MKPTDYPNIFTCEEFNKELKEKLPNFISFDKLDDQDELTYYKIESKYCYEIIEIEEATTDIIIHYYPYDKNLVILIGNKVIADLILDLNVEEIREKHYPCERHLPYFAGPFEFPDDYLFKK